MQLFKENLFKVLNGMSIGIIVALMPSAMLGNIIGQFDAPYLAMLLALSTSMLALAMGICIGLQFKLDPISLCILAISTMVSGGAVRGVVNGAIQVQGSGDVLNATLGAVIALAIILTFGHRLKAYKLLVLAPTTLIIVGTITSLTAAPVGAITGYVGMMIAHFTTLQPLIMSILIAMSFGLIIVSPLSTVAVALLIQLSGTGSAAANVGCAAAAITLGILNYRSNGLGTSLAHFLGSPKIQVANFIKSPIMILPGLAAGAIAAIFVPLFGAVGTPMSAGFGLSGLIGPLGHLGLTGFDAYNIFVAAFVFAVVPAVTSFAMAWLFRDVLKIVRDEQYKLDF
ncbi:MAG: PTS sugar transporter subunit IIC [Oscillospiraceae bacterium]|nr:PTS sugar transporter subunit IIC [Oscillospiraceae bacterium]